MPPPHQAQKEHAEFERTLPISRGQASARLREMLAERADGWSGEASDEDFELRTPDVFAPYVVGRFEAPERSHRQEACVVRARLVPNPLLRDFVRIVRTALSVVAVLTVIVWSAASPEASWRVFIQGVAIAGIFYATARLAFEGFIAVVDHYAGDARDAAESFIDDLCR